MNHSQFNMWGWSKPEWPKPEWHNPTPDETVHIGTVSKFKRTKLKPSRGGVICYTQHNGQTKYCLGVDRRSEDLTDLAGHINYKKESAVTGSLREFHEESLSIFRKYMNYDLDMARAIYDKNNLIIFVEVDIDPKEAIDLFNIKLSKCVLPEVTQLVWLSEMELYAVINNWATERPLYSRVKGCLFKSGYFDNLNPYKCLPQNPPYYQCKNYSM